MDQLSRASDRKLHDLSQKLGYAKFLKEKGESLHDEYWEEAFAIFEEHGIGRFIASDGHYLHKEPHAGTPKLVEERLKASLLAHFDGDEDLFNKYWRRITTVVPARRVVEPLKLEKQVRLGFIPNELVQNSIDTPPTNYHRIRKVWSADDVNRAFIFDVKAEDPAVVKQRQIKMLEELLAELRSEGVPSAVL